jgi:hypothetical protein
LAVDRRFTDAVHHLHPRGHLAEDRELAGQGRLVREHHEELVAAAVGAVGLENGGHGPARHGARRELGLEQAQPARPIERLLGRVLRERVAALDDPARHEAMEGRAVEPARARGLGEMAHVTGSEVGEHPYRERAVRGLDHGLQRTLLDDGSGTGRRGLARGRRRAGQERLAGQAQDQCEAKGAPHRAGPSA